VNLRFTIYDLRVPPVVARASRPCVGAGAGNPASPQTAVLYIWRAGSHLPSPIYHLPFLKGVLKRTGPFVCGSGTAGCRPGFLAFLGGSPVPDRRCVPDHFQRPLAVSRACLALQSFQLSGGFPASRGSRRVIGQPRAILPASGASKTGCRPPRCRTSANLGSGTGVPPVCPSPSALRVLCASALRKKRRDAENAEHRRESRARGVDRLCGMVCTENVQPPTRRQPIRSSLHWPDRQRRVNRKS
jgi:hypothetical protein